MKRSLFLLIFTVAILCFPLISEGQIISTVAGTGVAGNTGDGGPATAAQMYYPFGLTFDNGGNLYVADLNNNRIRKITPGGLITMFAGTSVSGYSGDGGPASSARLQNPTSMVFDGHGNMFITDHNNQRIRKVTPAGIISTIAGNGTTGFSGDGGPASAATLYSPTGIAIDALGNLFFCDQGNQVVRKIDTNGIITSVAGNLAGAFSGDGGPATAASIYAPNDLIIDGYGNLIISDAGNYRIRKVDTNGIITTIAGNGGTGFSGDGGPATAASIYNPVGLALDGSGNLLFAAQNHHRIRVINNVGIITTLVGSGTAGFSGDGGPATTAQLNNPCDVSMNSLGDLYIADTHNDRIRKVACATFSGGTISGSSDVCTGSNIVLTNTVSGGSWSSSNTSIATVGSLGTVTGIASGISTVSYTVTNACGTAVATHTMTVNPSPSIILGSNPSVCRGSTIATLPYSAAIGGPTSYTLNWSGAALAQGFSNMEPGGVITTVAGNGTWSSAGDGGPATNASFVFQFGIYGSPNGVVVDKFGNIFIADGNNQRIRKVEKATGVISTIAGTGIAGFSGDGGPATAAEINFPDAIDVDSSGNLYILDAQNYRVRKVNSSGIITTIAGNGTWGYSGDGGPATAAKLNIQLWSGLKSDNFGNLYFCDGQNNRIRKVNSSGIISTIAGNGTYGYTGDGGPATNAQIGEPLSVAIDAFGNLYISLTNEVVRKVDISGTISTVAGNGTSGYSGDGGAATAASFNMLTGIAVDKIGNLYIADRQNEVVRRVNTSGIISTVAGNGTSGFSGDGGSATLAQLWRPTGIAVDTFGNLYIGENTNMRVRKVTINTPLPSSPIPISVPVAALAGVYTATLTVSNGSCSSISYPISVTIDSTPVVDTISGLSTVNMGSTISLFNASTGGVWSSTNTSIATVGSAGLVSGIAPGIDTIRYTIANSCGSVSSFKVITVNPIAASSSCKIITTIAGTGVSGHTGDGGPATAARVTYPLGIVQDRNGNIYFADYVDLTVRKIDTIGVITTIAGGGTIFPGDGGPATSAVLQGPWDITVDTNGNLYFSDAHCIRKVSAAGIISTFSGTHSVNSFAGDGGPASGALFNGPAGLAIDRMGSIYIADVSNNRIRKISSAGIITTIAGNGSATFSGDGGPATSAGLRQPTGLTVDENLDVYFTDYQARVRKISQITGTIHTVAGTGITGYSGDGGPATAAELTGIFDVAIDQNRNLYIADYSNNRIRKVDSSGIITTVAGNGTGGFNGDGGQASLTQIYQPIGMCVTSDGSTLLFSDWQNHRVRKISNPVAPIAGPSIVSVGSSIPLSSITYGGTWSSSNPSLATVGSTGIVTGASSGIATISYTVITACGTSVATKVVTVTASSATACNGITTFAGNATMGYSGDGGAATSGMLSQPAGVAKDNNGNVYIADQFNHCIRKVNASGVITTFAGTGTAGFSGDGGPATSAQLNLPHALAIDANGNLIIADEYNYFIRKVSTTGIISTIAGTGVAGYSGDGGPATSAMFGHVFQMAIDNGGNIFFADQRNNNIRKISAGGMISTVAGDGNHAFYGDGGPATAAAMKWPSGIAVDDDGNLYIADSRNQRVRFVNAAGIISTIAGNGTPGYSGDGGAATAATVSHPESVAVDIVGNLYIGDNSSTIRKIDTSGIITTVAGIGTSGYSGDGGPATAAEFSSPYYIHIDIFENLYVADIGNNAVRKIVLPLSARSILGSPSVSVGSSISLSTTAGGGTWSSSNPSIATVSSIGIVIGISAGIDTISYTVTNACGSVVATKVVTVTASSGTSCSIITTIAGNGTLGYSGDGGPATGAQMHYPYSVCRDGIGNIYISDWQNNRIRKVDTFGVITTIAGTSAAGFSGDGGSATAAQLNGPTGINIDNAGNLYVSDRNNHRIRKINTSGIITTIAGNGTLGFSGDGGPATSAQLNSEWSLAVDASGNVYVTGNGNHRIRKISTAGIITTFAGNGSVGSGGDGGPATAAQLSSPNIRTVDASGNLYITEAGGNRLRKINGAGIINTIAGNGTVGFSGDGGPATAAQLNFPNGGGAVDALGNVYFADQQNNRVRKIDVSGIITTIAGNGTLGYTGDGGLPTAATLNGPIDVITDPLGNLYIVEQGNHIVRKIGLAALSVSSISGPSSVCIGSTITLSDSTSGGIWSSLNAAVATVGSTGIVTGMGVGTTIISYTVTNACGTVSANKTITVTASPGLISGATSVCTGDTIILSNATPGGSWTSSNTSIATIGSSTGVVTGVATGNVVITYSLGASCQATATVNVLSLPAVPSISGGTSVCIGLTTLLSNSMPGGFWYSTDASKATVSSSGLVTGISGGSVAIVYAVANSCGIGFNSVFVNISAPTPISGVPSVCVGATTTLSHSSPGGIWSSSNALIASVGSASGVVTGIAFGSSTITYTMGPGCFATINVSVNASSVSITGTSSLCITTSAMLGGAPSGGTWSSSNPSVAAVGPSGLVTGIASGTATISYTIGGGCYATKSVTVTTTGGPIMGTAGVCRGFTTTLTAPMPGGIWSSASTFFATVGSATGIVYGASPGTSVITYSVGAGCTSTITVTVRPVPAIMTVTGGGTFCAGGPGVNIGLPGSAVGINYQLYLGSIPVGSPLAGTGSSLSFGLQNIPGVYTVRAVDPITLCQSNMTGGATVTAYPLPIIGVSPGVAICSGGSTILTATGGISYTWSPGTGLTSTAGSVVNAHPVTTTTYTVTGTNSFGCSNTATVTVTVNPLPTISVGSGVAICSGSSTILTASGGTGYTWSPATGLSATTGATVVASPTTTRTYTVTGISGTGCINRATVTVTVSSLPGIVACPGVAICYGTSATLSASGGATYEWSPSVALSATTGASIVASPTVTTTYTVTGTNGTGCSNRATVTVTVNSLPTVSASSGGAICNGSSTTLSASGGVSYTWTPPAGLSATTGASITASPSVTTTYTVTGTNGSGCSDRATVTATVNASPSAISTTGNLCVGNSVTLTNATSGGVWSSSSPSIATIGSTTGVVTGVVSGTTTISYTLSSGCRAIMVVTVAALPSAISGPGTIYSGSSVTYTNATSGGIWSSSNTAVVSIGSVTGIATGVATGTATISYTVSSGCRTTLLVSVSATPTVYTVTGGGVHCYGGAAVPIGLSGSQIGVTYRLYIGGVATGSPVSGTGGPITFGAFTTAGTYTVIANPSSSSPVTMTSSAVVTVISSTMLPAPVAVTGGGTMCAGSPGLAINMPGSAVSVNYQLYRNGILTGSPLPGIGTALSFGLHTIPGVYTVIGTSTVNGCSNNMSGGASIAVFPTPNVYNVTGGGSFCTGVGGVVVGLSNSQSGVNYQLYNGTSAVGSLRPGTGAAFNFSTVTASGIYSVVGISSYCTANMSGTATVSANPVPSISGSIYTVAPAASITLTGSISGGVWTSGTPSVATIGSSTGIVTGVTLGSSTISYTLPSGCRGTRVIYVTPTGHRGISEDSSTYALFARRVYIRPNPNTGTFWISGDFGDDAEATLEIFNMLGQKVYSRVVRLQDGKLEEEIVLESIANGTYLLNVSSATYRDMFHIVVTK